MSRNGTWHRRIKHARRRLGVWAVPRIGVPLFRLLAKSWRIEWLERETYDGLERGFILALWHGRMLPAVRALDGEDLHVLVSMSGDGDVSEQLLQALGGGRGLGEMLGVLGTGGVIAIPPDGPRGPRHGMNPGLAWMAKATGYPILPMGFAVDRAWRLDSWDRFTIPKPRARVAVALGEPVRVARKADEDEMAQATELVRERLLDAETRAFRQLGAEPDF
ncbi:MAG: hypothetical protein K8S98_10005 [Planctomycetes bacterium]|nr:hypothetical protein [Planctomycetota bacterium]